ncbi:hypothetical protein [Bacillus cereus]|uniref:hypothetical protein n=1 Tax=Bacillus cereus TaxID=1396 RepID=UPI003BF62DBA
MTFVLFGATGDLAKRKIYPHYITYIEIKSFQSKYPLSGLGDVKYLMWIFKKE